MAFCFVNSSHLFWENYWENIGNSLFRHLDNYTCVKRNEHFYSSTFTAGLSPLYEKKCPRHLMRIISTNQERSTTGLCVGETDPTSLPILLLDLSLTAVPDYNITGPWHMIHTFILHEEYTFLTTT